MARKGTDRRLTTVLFADVVGYSRLMAEDEDGTLASLTQLREELIEPEVEARGGRIIKLLGDGFVIEFSSVVNAVSCALSIQRELETDQVSASPGKAIALRIGINIGDVIVDGDELYGNGLNVAARLEALAEPGGICVSDKVRQEIGNRLPAAFEDLGPQQLKNIPEPVRAYRVADATADTVPTRPPRAHRRPRLRAIVSALAVLVVILGAGLYWVRPWSPDFAPASPEKMAHPLPERPSLVVLPFDNLSNDAEQEYFVDGITEDLTTDLAKISGMFVISRNSAFTYKDRVVEIREIAEDLGVRYVLEGSVRRAGDQVRINAQLIDATTGGHLWADRYDGKMTDIFALQDQVTQRIVNELALELLPGERSRLAAARTDNAEAYDAYLVGLSAYYRRTPKHNAEAARHFERAIELDPDYSAAYTALAKVYIQAVTGEQAYAEELGIFWSHGYLKARQLLERGAREPNADVHVLRSWLALITHHHDTSVEEARMALDLNPNHAEALETLAEALIFAGSADEGREFAERARRQNPTLQARPLYLLGLADFALGRTESAARQLANAVAQAPGQRSEFAGLQAAVHGELGDTERAEEAFRAFSEGYIDRPMLAWQVRSDPFANPRYHTWRRIDLAWSVYSFPFADSETLDRLAQGFMKAGAPTSVAGYLPLTRANLLNGDEVRSLMFEREIGGLDFWLSSFSWRQTRDRDGNVRHSGYPVHAGLPETAVGHGEIRDGMLCETWPALGESGERCIVVFRVPDPKARVRWGDYVMITEIGPHPFSIAE